MAMKKRVARNKALHNVKHEIHPEDCDAMDNSIQGMDIGIPSISTKQFVSNLLESSRAFSQEKAQNGPATSRDHVNVSKAKVFKCDCKFPIMERSLKEMKNAKHNRKLLNTRAHLAGLSNLSNSPSNNNLLPTEKSKKTILASKMKKKMVEESGKNVSKKPKPCVVKSSELVEESKSKGYNKYKPNVRNDSSVGESNRKCSNKHKLNMRNDSSVGESPVLETNCDKSDSSSDSDEYEIFIQKEKKDLPKKYRKNSNTKRKKPPPTKKVSKSASKNISTESDSDFGDEESEPSYKKRKRIKNNKPAPGNRQSRISIEKDSESEMNVINNGPHYDSSSESDTPNGVASNSNSCNNQLPRQISTEQSSVPVSEFNLLLNMSGINSLVGRDHVLHATPDVVSSVIDDHPTFLNKSSGIISSASNHPTMSSKACSTFKNDSDYKLNQGNSVIDLTESGEEDERDICLPKIIMVSSAIQNGPSCSEESDIELVDVIVNNQPEKVDGSKELNIKTEKVDRTPSCSNEKPQNIPLNKTYEVANSTNICQEQNETESKVVNEQVNLNNELQSCLSMPSNSKESIVLNKKGKNEPCHDCEIILDTITTNNSTRYLPVSTSVKVKKDVKSSDTIVGVSDSNAHANKSNSYVTEKEQKLHEVACSNFKNLSDMYQKKMKPVAKEEVTTPTPVDIKIAIQTLKEEFAAYQEILQTERLMESFFKLLEKHQAEKLMSLKSRVTKLLKSTAGSSAGDAIQHAMSKQRDSSIR